MLGVAAVITQRALRRGVRVHTTDALRWWEVGEADLLPCLVDGTFQVLFGCSDMDVLLYLVHIAAVSIATKALNAICESPMGLMRSLAMDCEKIIGAPINLVRLEMAVFAAIDWRIIEISTR